MDQQLSHQAPKHEKNERLCGLDFWLIVNCMNDSAANLHND